MTLEEYSNQQHEIDLVVFHGIFKTQNSRSMWCHVEDVCWRMLIFSRKVLKDRGESGHDVRVSRLSTWMSTVGGPVMTRTTHHFS